MTDSSRRRGDRAAWITATLFGVLLVAVVGAGIWFAVRDSESAALATAELTEKPAARLEGASFDTTYSAYTVEPPPFVDALRTATMTTETTTTDSTTLREKSARSPESSADADGYTGANFKQLAGFEYGVKAMTSADEPTSVPAGRRQPIPPDVQALSGKKVSVTGYMMPIDFEGGRVRSFLLMRNQLLCCFGIAPRLNDFVAVQVADRKGVPAVKDVPITARGTLQVGEITNNGVPLALYTMIADDVRMAGKQ